MRDKKRFRVKRDEIDSAVINIQDNHQDFAWFLSDVIIDEQVKKVVDLLNEQQDTIGKLQKENIELKKLRKYCAEWMGVKEENLYDVVR